MKFKGVSAVAVCIILLTSSVVGCADSGADEKPKPEPPVPMQNTISGDVFLSASHLSTLGARSAQKIEPTYSAFLKLQQQAQTALTQEPKPPGTWYVPFYYKDAAGHTAAKEALERDANNAYTLALCYRMTGDEEYSLAAARNINAWVSGVRELKKHHDSSLSFSYHFPAFIFAADLLKNSSSWPPAQQAEFRRFVREKALPMNTMDRDNNWGNWGMVLVMASAAYLQDQTLFESAVARWKEFIEIQIAPDGHLPHEVTRNNGIGERGLWYSHFSLMPQTIAAEIARANGVDLYDYKSPGGRTLRSAFEWLAPYARNSERFPYFKPGTRDIKQLGADYFSYFEILNSRWPQPDVTAALAAKRPMTARHTAPHLTFTHGNSLQTTDE